ncbi:MAG: sigma-70 family RNA polymerase sigma factor [Thermoleophilaceae bacterium]
MEASALRHQAGIGSLGGRSPLLRLQGDERLVALVRQGNQSAFEALVQRYQPRLLAFCRHMLSSKEDAEDVLQEVFAAAYNALLADDRPINVRPWLYRIARNRSLNHLRKPKATGLDSMDIFERENGTTTAETVHSREEFRQIVSDVQDLPETQKTALLLREIDALSYEHIAEAMDTTVPSVKSLLVRARVSLAEAAEARLLTCEEVRLRAGPGGRGHRKVHAAGTPAPQVLRALPRVPRRAAQHDQGPRRRVPARPTGDPQEDRDRQARARRSGRRRLGERGRSGPRRGSRPGRHRSGRERRGRRPLGRRRHRGLQGSRRHGGRRDRDRRGRRGEAGGKARRHPGLRGGHAHRRAPRPAARPAPPPRPSPRPRRRARPR